MNPTLLKTAAQFAAGNMINKSGSFHPIKSATKVATAPVRMAGKAVAAPFKMAGKATVGTAKGIGRVGEKSHQLARTSVNKAAQPVVKLGTKGLGSALGLTQDEMADVQSEVNSMMQSGNWTKGLAAGKRAGRSNIDQEQEQSQANSDGASGVAKSASDEQVSQDTSQKPSLIGRMKDTAQSFLPKIDIAKENPTLARHMDEQKAEQAEQTGPEAGE